MVWGTRSKKDTQMTQQLCPGWKEYCLGNSESELEQCFVKFKHEYESPRQVVKTQNAGPHAQSFMGLRIYISSKFSDNADDAGLGNTL